MNKENLDALIKTLKGVIPANFDSMERLVSCVQYLESVLAGMKERENAEETNGG